MRRIVQLISLVMIVLFPLLVGGMHLLCLKAKCSSIPAKTTASVTTEAHSHCGSNNASSPLASKPTTHHGEDSPQAPCCCDKKSTPLVVNLPPVQPYPNSANFAFAPVLLTTISAPSASQVSAQEYHPPPPTCQELSVLRL